MELVPVVLLGQELLPHPALIGQLLHILSARILLSNWHFIWMFIPVFRLRLYLCLFLLLAPSKKHSPFVQYTRQWMPPILILIATTIKEFICCASLITHRRKSHEVDLFVLFRKNNPFPFKHCSFKKNTKSSYLKKINNLNRKLLTCNCNFKGFYDW